MKALKAYVGSAVAFVILCGISWAILSLARLAWQSVLVSPSPFSVSGVEILVGAVLFLLLLKLIDWSDD